MEHGNEGSKMMTMQCGRVRVAIYTENTIEMSIGSRLACTETCTFNMDTMRHSAVILVPYSYLCDTRRYETISC